MLGGSYLLPFSCSFILYLHFMGKGILRGKQFCSLFYFTNSFTLAMIITATSLMSEVLEFAILMI